MSEQYDRALSFYNDAENYRFFCIVGNIHDENDQEKFDEFLAKVDALATKHNVTCVITSSLPVEDATDAEKMYL